MRAQLYAWAGDPRRLRAIAACAGAVLATALGTSSGALTALDRRLSDAWFGAASRPPSGEIVLVSIDRAVAERGDGLRLPRAHLASLVGRLSEAGAERVLLDLSLSGTTNAADDLALEGVLAQLGGSRVALSAAAIRAGGGSDARWDRTRIDERFTRSATTAASDLALDPDMVLRRVGIDSADLPAIPSTSDWLAGLPAGAGREPWRIDYGIDVRQVPVVDALSVLDGGLDPARLAGRRVIVASFASALGHAIQVPRFGALQRSEITALAGESVLAGRSVRPLGLLPVLAGALGLAVLATIWLMRLGPALAVGTALGLALCAVGLSAQAQIATGLIVPAAPFVLALFAALGAAMVATHPRLERVRDAIGGLAGRFDLRLARALDVAGEALVTFAPDGQVLSMNAAARRLFDRREEAGVSVADLIGPQAGALIDATRSSQPGRLEALVAGAAGHRHLDLTVNAVTARAGGWIGVASIRDVTDQRDQLAALKRMVHQDALTGLANRVAFERALAEAVAASREGEPCAVLLCDLDGFKGVNDTLGHQAGDLLLCEVARRLAGGVGPGDTVARLGGDEFALVLRPGSASGPFAPEAIAARLAEAVREPVLVEGRTVQVGISIGVAHGPAVGQGPEDLVRAADAAMYHAKRHRLGVALAGAARAA